MVNRCDYVVLCMSLTYFGTSPVFSSDFEPLVSLESRTTAGRLGSPITSIIRSGVPVLFLSGPEEHSPRAELPSKGLLQTTENSPDGGGAIERGILVVVVVPCLGNVVFGAKEICVRCRIVCAGLRFDARYAELQV